MKAVSALCATALALSSCASPSAPVGQAVGQPFRDLSVVRETTPEALQRSAASPYVRPADCAAIRAELAALDAALGPDLDAPRTSDGQAGAELLAEAISEVVSLPFRGVVRRISGAHQRDRQKAEAIVAGVGRRGYLRGLATERGC